MLKYIKMELQVRHSYLKNKTIETIYFGGGTPSILSKRELKVILDTIYKIYTISENVEITLECNPDDLDEQKLKALKAIGVNRLSIGVQSFNENDLKMMNRSHNAIQAENSLKLAKHIGFENITIDLIYGFPAQSLRDWESNLNKMFTFNLPHFSAYALTIENKTALKYLVEKKKIKLLDECKILEQFNTLIQTAEENGFVHYEISNFAKEGFFSKHNTAYWQHNHYLGIGPSAHSFNGESRSWNPPSNKKYIQNIHKRKDCFETEWLTNNEKYNEYIFTSLRTIWGTNSNTIKAQFGENLQAHFLKEVQKWEQQKRIKKSKDIYTLTTSGKFVADTIASDLFLI